MVDSKIIPTIIACLDKYMLLHGKSSINDMEANGELERMGLLKDSLPSPGEPLREILSNLRDSNMLPNNISQRYGSWSIRLSRTITKNQEILQFQY